MRKIVLLFIMAFSNMLIAETVSEDFSGWSDPSYGGVATFTDANGGQWESNNALVNSLNGCNGASVRFNDDSGANEYVVYKGLDGNGKDGGVGTISFNYRHWDGDGSTVEFQVEYSLNNGATWTDVGTSVVVSSTTCTTFSEDVEITNDDVWIRIRAVEDEERLLIDDFAVTDFDLPTPVTLAFFDAKPVNNKIVALDWSTASEENNEYFSVEHSTDGRDFVEVGMVLGAVNSSSMLYYSYTHDNAAEGVNYYRLRQVDTDGTFSFSPIEAVRVANKMEVDIFPTLAETQVTLAISAELDNDVQIEVYNILGRLIRTDILERGATQAILNVANLQKGQYLVRIANGTDVHTSRFIKK